MDNQFPLAQWRKKYKANEPLACITAYDRMTALLAGNANIDLVLVGDSLSNVIQGNKTTVPLTLSELIYHTQIVVRTIPDKLIIADMPFGTFKISTEQTVKHCVQVIKETGCTGVKLEGATDCDLQAIEMLVNLGIPVMGHLGLLPQTVNQLGGYIIRGKTQEDTSLLIEQAKKLENVGVFAIVLECVEANSAKLITEAVDVPTIGIGSGNHVSGQILVIHDLLGMLPDTPPSFVKPQANLYQEGLLGLNNWVKSVKQR